MDDIGDFQRNKLSLENQIEYCRRELKRKRAMLHRSPHASVVLRRDIRALESIVDTLGELMEREQAGNGDLANS